MGRMMSPNRGWTCSLPRRSGAVIRLITDLISAPNHRLRSTLTLFGKKAASIALNPNARIMPKSGRVHEREGLQNFGIFMLKEWFLKIKKPYSISLTLHLVGCQRIFTRSHYEIDLLFFVAKLINHDCSSKPTRFDSRDILHGEIQIIGQRPVSSICLT